MRTFKHRLAAALLALALLGVPGPFARAAPGDGTDSDETFIVVHKTFVGITDAAKINTSFTITLSNGDVTHTLTSANRASTDSEVDTQGNIVWQWNVYTPAGTYTTSESDTDIAGYSLISSEGLGTVETSTTIKDMTVPSPIIADNPDGTGQDKYFPISADAEMIYIELSSGSTTEWFVWTQNSLSENKRTAFRTALNIPSTTLVYFFSGDKIGDEAGLTFKNTTIRYEVIDGQGRLYCHNSVLDKGGSFGYGSFTYGETGSGDITVTNAEVEIVNTYAPNTTTLTVTKTVTGNAGDTSQAFSFIVSAQGGTTLLSDSFSLKHGESSAEIPVPIGQPFTVTESGADGYALTVNGEPITGYSYTYTPQSADPITLNFVNDLTVPPDMGITLDVLPYALILLGVGAAALVLLLRRRRDDDDDGEEW